jgi:hypothetical protein
MAPKKSNEPEKTPQEEALEQKVDEMMSIEKHDTDVSKLAEDFNKQAMSDEKVSGKIEVQTGAPELPSKLQVEDAPEPVEPVKEEDLNKEAASPTEQEEATVPWETQDSAGEVADTPLQSEDFSDEATDEAVDEIVAEEGDTALAVEDARRKKATVGQDSGGWKTNLTAFFKSKWTWVGLLIILVAVFALPFTRYKVLGLAIKKPVTVTVIDSKTASPVSNADVQLAGTTAKTDEDGHVQLNSGVGDHKLIVTKKYYTDYSGSYFVGFSNKVGQNVKLVATGRLVPVMVTNKITGKPITGAQVEVKGTTSKTNSKGKAEVALPVKADTYKGVIKLSGFNDADITIQVTDKQVKANSFGLMPKGHIYFLSNLNGTLDVVKANLDGSGRKVVLEGTGNEQPAATSLLASRDWRYLVLKARRDTPQAALYVIDTSNDKVTPFDNSDADFTLVGWYGHSFIYSLTKNNIGYWQPGKQALKSYDAEHQQPNLLDQSQAEGSQASYAYQTFLNFYILNGVVTYNTQWYAYGMDEAGKSDTIRAVQPNGQAKKDYQSFAASDTAYIQAALYEPQSVYYAVHNSSDGKTTYYEFENQSANTTSIDQSKFDQGYPTYLLSPSGNKTFWTELRDGKNALFTGDANAGNKKQVASLSDYSPYGWYGDSYVLVSKNSSELYVMSPSTPNEPPVKITDYYKPAQTFQGYGYGYGGL